jgi:hypothetical protein
VAHVDKPDRYGINIDTATLYHAPFDSHFQYASNEPRNSLPLRHCHTLGPFQSAQAFKIRKKNPKKIDIHTIHHFTANIHPLPLYVTPFDSPSQRASNEPKKHCHPATATRHSHFNSHKLSKSEKKSEFF